MTSKITSPKANIKHKLFAGNPVVFKNELKIGICITETPKITEPIIPNKNILFENKFISPILLSSLLQLKAWKF